MCQFSFSQDLSIECIFNPWNNQLQDQVQSSQVHDGARGHKPLLCLRWAVQEEDKGMMPCVGWEQQEETQWAANELYLQAVPLIHGQHCGTQTPTHNAWSTYQKDVLCLNTCRAAEAKTCPGGQNVIDLCAFLIFNETPLGFKLLNIYIIKAVFHFIEIAISGLGI